MMVLEILVIVLAACLTGALLLWRREHARWVHVRELLELDVEAARKAMHAAKDEGDNENYLVCAGELSAAMRISGGIKAMK